MRIEELQCTNFRNYDTLQVALHEGLNAITGPNGSGKTTILDAIAYLATCRTPLGSPDGSLVRFETDQLTISGRFRENERGVQVAIKYQRGKGKSLRIDDVPVKQLSSHVGRIPLVSIYPAHLQLAQDGGELRRLFINHAIAQQNPDYLANLQAHNHFLATRNQELKSPSSDMTLLDVLDEQLAQHAIPIHHERLAYCNALQPLLGEYYAKISHGREKAEIGYRSHLFESEYRHQLWASRGNDRQLMHTTRGVHRDTLDLLLDGHPIRETASQGQQKCFIIALKLAQLALLAEAKQERPLLLIDDIFDRLDPDRARALLGLIAEPPCGQVLITEASGARIREASKNLPAEWALLETNGDSLLPK